MTPGKVKTVVAALQERIRTLEGAVDAQKSANVAYYDVGHELAEAWEALDRANDLLDEIGMGAS